jgi:phospholipid/cholesterol/gamma-HCH transport system substrate-binding protein
VRRSWAAVTVGALALAVIISAFLLFQYTSERMSPGEGYTVFARFNDALGLTEKSRVMSAGIRVGQIESKRLDGNKARITIRMDGDIPVYENALIAKKSASLLGEFYLDLDPGMPEGIVKGKRVPMRRLQEGDEIKNVEEQTDVGKILDEVGATIPILREILTDVRELTSGTVKDIAENTNELIERNSVVLERLLTRVDNIAATIETITREEADDVQASLRNIRDITEGVKALVGKEGEVTATGKDIKSSVERLQTSIERLERSLGHVEKVTGRVAEGKGTVGRLLADETIADNIEEITEDASTFVRGVTRLQTIVGLRTEYNYLANTFKTYFQVQLMPRPDKFYLIEIVDDPRGYREATTTVGVSSDRGAFSETQIKTSEKLRITFQFGKTWGPWTARFGIKESTGGAGLDVRLLNEKLMLSADLFDTRSNQYPRLQGRASYAVYKRYLHLMAGVDDVLNFTRTQGAAGGFFDWFFGAQLIFNDEDMKTLLLFGGGAAASAGQ